MKVAVVVAVAEVNVATLPTTTRHGAVPAMQLLRRRVAARLASRIHLAEHALGMLANLSTTNGKRQRLPRLRSQRRWKVLRLKTTKPSLSTSQHAAICIFKTKQNHCIRAARHTTTPLCLRSFLIDS